MRACEDRFEQISMLLDGALSEEEAAEVRAHLEHCPDCAAVYAALSGVGEAAAEEVPAGLHDKIMGSVDQASRAQKAQRRFRILRPTLTAAACLVVIVGTILLTGNLMQKSQNKSAETMSTSASAAAGGAVYSAKSEAPMEPAAAPMAPNTDEYAVYDVPAEEPMPMPESVEEPAAITSDMLDTSMIAVSNASATVTFTAVVEETAEDGTLLVTVQEAESSALEPGERWRITLGDRADAGAIEPGTPVRITLSVPQLPLPEEEAAAGTLLADSVEPIGE